MPPRQRVGPIRTLSEACEARRPLWFLCLNCGHAHRVEPRALVLQVRRDLTLDALRWRLKCRRCHMRHRATVIVDDQGEVAGR